MQELFDDDSNEGPSLDGEEFLEMMAERGLIVPRPPTLRERLWHAAGAPWRALKRVGGWIAWKIWGKKYYEKQLTKQIDRMKKLAGVDGSTPPTYSVVEKVAYLDKAKADMVRLEVDRRIIREELPKPDFDDSGLN